MRRLLPIVLRTSYLPALALAAVLALRLEHSPVTGNTYGGAYARFELLGLTGVVWLLFVGWSEWILSSVRSRARAAVLLGGLLVGLHALYYITEHSHPSWDYQCYEYGASVLTLGENPYLPDPQSGKMYLYPPLFAQTIVYLYLGLIKFQTDPEAAGTIFFLYQVMQFGLVVGGYALTVAFCRQLGARPSATAIVATLVWTVNNPLMRSLRHNQANLILLDLSLLALVMARRAPEVAGFAIALASHLKIYPLILGGPFAATRRWRTVAAIIAGLVLLFGVSASARGGVGVWSDFLHSMANFPTGHTPRNNGVTNIVFELVEMPVRMRGGDPAFWDGPHRLVARTLRVLIAVWLGVRFLLRERAARRDDNPERSTMWRLFGHSADAFAAMLLLSPLVWEHHYVLAIPVIVWALATTGDRRPIAVAVGAFLTIGMPTFDLWPFSACRLVGLLILVIAAAPSLPPSWRGPRLIDGDDEPAGLFAGQSSSSSG